MVVWSDLGEQGSELQEAVSKLQAAVGDQPKVSVENWERLGLAGHSKSSFQHVFSGCLGLATVDHSLDVLASLTSLLSPGGRLSLVQALPGSQPPSSLTSLLVLAGLSPAPGSLPTVVEGGEATRAKLGDVTLYSVCATKPKHEVGASRLLSFGKKDAPEIGRAHV